MRKLTTAILATALISTATLVVAQDKGLVVYSQAGMENEWRVMNTQEMESAFKSAGYDFAWTNANSDPAKQLSDIEDLLARQPALLVVAPIEYEPMAPVPDMAAEAGVPLMVVDRALPGTPGEGQWIALLTTDFVDTGEQVARDVVDEMVKKNGSEAGKLLHVTGNKGASPVVDEQTGLDNVFDAYENITIVASCDGLYSREPGRKCTEDLLQAFPAGEIDGIIFDNDDMMIGGIQAVKAAGRDELVGYLWAKDGTVDGLQALLDGDATFTVQTPPYFGELSVEVFEKFMAGEDIMPKVQFVPKETFDNDTPEQKARVQERIEELKALGVGCC